MATYHSCFSPQVLRYDKNSETYGYSAVNFGACKGETFDRVIIIPNGPLMQFIKKGTELASPEKYYVAVTRPKYSIAIVFSDLPLSLNDYEEVWVDCGKNTFEHKNTKFKYHKLKGVRNAADRCS